MSGTVADSSAGKPGISGSRQNASVSKYMRGKKRTDGMPTLGKGKSNTSQGSGTGK